MKKNNVQHKVFDISQVQCNFEIALIRFFDGTANLVIFNNNCVLLMCLVLAQVCIRINFDFYSCDLKSLRVNSAFILGHEKIIPVSGFLQTALPIKEESQRCRVTQNIKRFLYFDFRQEFVALLPPDSASP